MRKSLVRRSTRNPDEPLHIAMIGLRGIPASYGGVETAVEQLAPRLVDSGYEVTVYTRPAYVDAKAGTYRGVRLRSAFTINTKHLEAVSHTICALVDALKPSRGVDVIHFHATGPALFAWIPRLLGVPTVATIQGWDWRRGKWGTAAQFVLRLAAWTAVWVPDQVIGVSRQLVSDAERFYGRKIRYVPNGVNPPHTLSNGDRPASELHDLLGDGKVVVFLGRIVPEKEVLTLVKAFQALEGAKLRLVVAGPSSHSDEYVRQVEEAASADERVHVVGPQYGADKSWLFERATIFVQPSNLEGLPLTLLEAIGHGAYPVVSNIGPHLEAVEALPELGQMAPEPGDVGGLTQAMKDALDLSSDDRRDGANALRDSVRVRYDWDTITRATAAVYDDIARRSLRPAPDELG